MAVLFLGLLVRFIYGPFGRASSGRNTREIEELRARVERLESELRTPTDH